MRIPRIHVDLPLAADQILELPQKQSNYLCRALRMTPGRPLWLFNGGGDAYQAEIVSADPKRAQVKVGTRSDQDLESPLEIELGIALSKGDRFDFVVQKATELGVWRIQPLLTERSEVRVNADRLNKKRLHWQGIAISACEQSGRNKLPEIGEPLTLEAWSGNLSQKTRLTMKPDAGESIKKVRVMDQQVAVLIGPEGGLSPQEVEFSEKAGFNGITLGPRVLRTETAPLVVLSVLQSLWGDL